MSILSSTLTSNEWEYLTSTMSFNALLKDFYNYLSFLSPRSKQSYITYVNIVNSANDGMTLQWLKDAATNADPLGELSKIFDNFFNGKPIDPKTKSNCKTGLLTLGKFVFGFNKSSW